MEINGEVAGSFVHKFIDSFLYSYTLSKGEAETLSQDFEKDQCYPIGDFLELLENLTARHSNPASILFFAGKEFSRTWFIHAGSSAPNSSLEFLQFNQNFGLLSDVFHKLEESRFNIKLLEFNETSKFSLSLTSPFPQEFIKGIFFEGMNLFDDLDFVEVLVRSEQSDKVASWMNQYIDITFRPIGDVKQSLDLDESLRAFQNGEKLTLSQEQLEALAWKYLGVKKQKGVESIYQRELISYKQKNLDKYNEQTSRLSLLNEMGLELGGAKSQEESFQICARFLKRIMGADFACINLIEKESESIKIFSASQETLNVENFYRIPFQGSAQEEICKSKGDILLNEVSDRDFSENSMLMEKGVRSRIVSPLIILGKVIGTLDVGKKRGKSFDQSHLQIISQIGYVLSRTLENQLLQQKTKNSISQSQLALRKLEVANKVVEKSPVVLFRWEIEGNNWKLDYVSPNVTQYGYDAKDFQGDAYDFAKIVHPEDIERVFNYAETELARGANYVEQEYRIIDKKGGVKWILDRAMIERTEEGIPTHTQSTLLDISERKTIENQLRENKNQLAIILGRFKLLLDTIDYGILFMDKDLNLLVANRAACRMWNFSDELINSNPSFDDILEFNRYSGIYEVEDDKWEEYKKDRISSITSPDGVPKSEFKRQDGSVLSYQVQVLPDGGRMLNYFDISEQKKAEEEIKKREQDIRYILDKLPIPIAINDTKGFCLYGNESLERTMVCLPGEGVGKHVTEIIKRGEDLQLLMNVVKRGKARKNREILYTKYNGETFWGSTSFFPFQYKGRRAILTTVYDLSERKHAEEMLNIAKENAEAANLELRVSKKSLELERRLLRNIIDATPDWIFVKDLDHKYTLVNKAFAEAHGMKSEDMIGKNDLGVGVPEELVYGNPEKGIKGFWKDDDEVVASRVPKFIEEEHLEKEGRKTYLHTVKVPLIDEDEEAFGLLGFVHDITKLKDNERELKEAKNAAEAASRAKGEFLANMSHEIRTPMNGVIGMTSLLLDTPLDHEQHDYVDTIRTSGDSLLTIINDILDFSKIESGKLELEEQPFYLRNCVEEVLDLVAHKAAGKKLELAYLIEANTPETIIGDVTRLRQILLNLLNNAIKFTDKGEVVLSVNANCLNAKKGEYELHFEVRDTGIGIPKDRISRLFRSFSQVDASTTRKYGGTGLGLAISKQLSNLMGGAMWVESEGIPGKGSQFHFTIKARHNKNQKELKENEALPKLAAKRVLIVDDNETNRLILLQYAKGWKMDVELCEGGNEALEKIANEDPFDIAILDMQMPEMDGIQLAQNLRKLEKGKDLPLIMLTSLGNQVDKKSSEFEALLNKPIKPAALVNVLVGIFVKQPVLVKSQDRKSEFDKSIGEKNPLKILLAEDNVVNQKVAQRMLGRIGYRIDIAANGQEAIESLSRQAYDVILMDIQMPEMDGMEATKLIRSRWAADKQPYIIAMTANALQGDKEKYLAIGMNDYVSKPVRVQELVVALAKCKPLNV
ncbi:MAG: response regulator [Bacteroidia bacterium]|nr:response regulator [Bacteroidia bacterium]